MLKKYESNTLRKNLLDEIEKQIQLYFDHLVKEGHFVLTPQRKVIAGVVIEGYRNGSEFAKIFRQQLWMSTESLFESLTEKEAEKTVEGSGD